MEIRLVSSNTVFSTVKGYVTVTELLKFQIYVTVFFDKKTWYESFKDISKVGLLSELSIQKGKNRKEYCRHSTNTANLADSFLFFGSTIEYLYTVLCLLPV